MISVDDNVLREQVRARSIEMSFKAHLSPALLLGLAVKKSAGNLSHSILKSSGLPRSLRVHRTWSVVNDK